MTITIEYISQMRQVLLTFYEKTGEFIQGNGSLPSPGSQALTEQATYARPQSIVSAYAIGTQLIEHGGEHLTAFVKTITEPVELIACWTCVRSMLESCALAAWLLDPDTDAHTRVGRVFALRYEGMDQELKFGRAANVPESEIDGLKSHIDNVEQIAISLGFSPVVSKKGKRIGIAQIFPDATDMIEMMLKEHVKYRLLSGVAHGHHWAIRQLCYTPTNEPDIDLGGVLTKPFEKTTNLMGIAVLGTTTFRALAKPLWNQCRFFGWKQLHLEELLEDAADGLQLNDVTRFWRS